MQAFEEREGELAYRAAHFEKRREHRTFLEGFGQAQGLPVNGFQGNGRSFASGLQRRHRFPPEYEIDETNPFHLESLRLPESDAPEI
jgi:hypothetical protein